MKLKSMIAALLLMAAGLQTAWGQGFRVYKSDGTVAQFSFRTDSIVFYDGIGTDEDFGPFTPVNQCIVGTWYESETETLTFNGDGTTDYIDGATYKFLPYRGTIIIYNAGGAPTNILKVHDLTADQMILSVLGSETFRVLSRIKPVKPVTRITLSPKELTMKQGTSKDVIATALPVSASNREVTWRSSRPEVATVEASGRNATITAVGVGSCVIVCSATDGSGVYAECPVTVTSGDLEEQAYLTCPDGHHPHIIDLGLPNGTKWACCNVGASIPEGYGGYYAWGETNEKGVYNEVTYQYSSEGIGSDIAGTGYDAATINMGSHWCMPSITQIEELLYNCTQTWITQNGVNGILVTGRNGGQVFLPATGGYGYDGGSILYGDGDYGFYWSSSLDPDNDNRAGYLIFDSGGWGWLSVWGYDGHPVRPVRKQ